MKKLNLTINNCNECPYCRKDYYSSMYKPAGYDCVNPNLNDIARIFNDGDEGSIFEIIPDWCPLEDVEEK